MRSRSLEIKSILNDINIVKEIENVWHQQLGCVDVPDFDWWEYCKSQCKDKLIFLSKKAKHERNLEKSRLKCDIVQYKKL